MQQPIDRPYYAARARAERATAAAACNATVAAVHLQLAEQYERLLSGEVAAPPSEDRSDRWPTLGIVTMPAAVGK